MQMLINQKCDGKIGYKIIHKLFISLHHLKIFRLLGSDVNIEISDENLINSAYRLEFSNFAIPYRRIRRFPSVIDDDVNKDLHMLSDDANSYFMCWFTYKQSIMFDSLQKFILEVHQHGFVSHFERKNTPRAADIPEDEPKVLTMQMLSAGFGLWLGSIIIAIVAFFGEHVAKNFEMRKRKLKRKNVLIPTRLLKT